LAQPLVLAESRRSAEGVGNAVKNFNLRFLFVATFLAAIACWYITSFMQTQAYSGLASDIGTAKEGWRRYGDMDSDAHIKIETNSSLTRSQPEWKNTEPNPPVSARQALQIADKFRRERFKDHSRYDWSLEHVALTPLDIKSDKWCWIVLFEAVPKNGGDGRWPKFPVYVLMDGSTIEPKDPEGFLKIK
jgi:hypothetical protein